MKIKFNSPITIMLTLVSCLVLIADTVFLHTLTPNVFSVYRAPLSSPLTYFRFISHIFGHASLEHLVGNISLLLIVGSIVEDRIGSIRYLSYVLLTALVIGACQFLLFPSTALCGMSGVVFMLIVLAAYGDSRESKTIPLTVLLTILIWIGREVFNAVFSVDNISQFSHLLGGWCGFLLGLRNTDIKTH